MDRPRDGVVGLSGASDGGAEVHDFYFVERCVSLPVYHVRAGTLEAACEGYQKLLAMDEKQSEEVQEQELVGVYRDDQELPQNEWGRAVKAERASTGCWPRGCGPGTL